jgi:hypothetical protein
MFTIYGMSSLTNMSNISKIYNMITDKRTIAHIGFIYGVTLVVRPCICVFKDPLTPLIYAGLSGCGAQLITEFIHDLFPQRLKLIIPAVLIGGIVYNLHLYKYNSRWTCSI